MKKLIVIMLALTLTCALAACSEGQTKVPDGTGDSASVQTEDASASTEEAAMIQSYMGQVSDKVGNEITVSLGEIVLDSSESSGEAVYVDENGNQEVRPKDDDAFDGQDVATVIVPMPDDAAGDAAAGETGNAPAEKLPIEFTGEVREFTIPAGAKITNALGKEVSFDNVTKGSLVQLIVNETTGVVERVMVM